MKNLLTLTSVLALTAGTASAQEMSFNRIATFPTFLNMADGEDTARVSSAEIVSATKDGMTLVYSDSPLGGIGLIDISDPAAPKPLGNLDMGGEPTAVSVLGNTRALVAVNTSDSYAAPSGRLATIDLTTRTEIASCDLGGQPDSTAIAPDGSFVAVAIENERDEDAGDGGLPQMPAGYLVILPIDGDTVTCDALIKADVTGLAEIGAEDPEPEFVDVNANGEIVVTMQENNHIVVLGADGAVLSHFSAGSVDLDGIDTDEEGALTFGKSQPGRLREPDGVQWIDTDHFAIANEGDWNGGSRGFTVFHKDGTLVYDSGTSFEYAIVAAGHYPEKRSGNKGAEPEGMEFAVIDGTPTLFLLSERASMVGVYDMTDPAAPELKQLLPSGISPEGAIALPARGLLATANELDLIEDGGPRASVMLFQYGEGAPVYPMLTSAGLTENGKPVGWGAMSGMVAGADGMIYAVNDSFYAMQPTIFTIDPAQTPARITGVTRVTRGGQPAQKLDMEGITLDGKGGYWIASEGRSDRLVPHALYNVNAKGAIRAEIALPPELLANEIRFGFEGITLVGDTLWMAVQREWKDDPKGMVKLVAYNIDSKEWGAVHYPLDTPAAGWEGLSEIVAHGAWFYVVERDNQIADRGVTKKVYRVPASDMVPATLGSTLPVLTKELVRDLMPDLMQLNGYVQDKVEGLAIMADGTAWIATDNDGVDDSSGETLFFSIGNLD